MSVSVLRQTTPQSEFSAARTVFGTVRARRSAGLEIEVPHGVCLARVGASCLLTPAVGDRVLVAEQGDEAFILVVLESATKNACLEVDGNLSIRTPSGKLELLSRDDLSVRCYSRAVLQAEVLEASAEESRMDFGTLRLVGRVLDSQVKQFRVVAKTCDTIASRIYQRAVQFVRRTDEHDLVESRTMDRRCERLMHLRGENIVTTASELTKINATQVHVG